MKNFPVAALVSIILAVSQGAVPMVRAEITPCSVSSRPIPPQSATWTKPGPQWFSLASGGIWSSVSAVMAGDVTRILNAAGEDGRLPSEDLLPLVYDELRSLASSRMSGEAQGQTLQATALVHEAWLRVSGKGGRTWNDRAHFFRVAALEMRRILVEAARRKSSLKRGPDMQRINIDDVDLAATQPDDRIVLIDEMLQRLEVEDPASARIVTLKFFGGLTNREVAEMEGVGERTIERQWAFARTCLFEMIRNET